MKKNVFEMFYKLGGEKTYKKPVCEVVNCSNTPKT